MSGLLPWATFSAATTGLRQTTDLLIDPVRAVSNRRLLERLGQ